MLKDEIFHVPQAQKYCNGNFRSWDPMITTPPGLYVHNSIIWFLELKVLGLILDYQATGLFIYLSEKMP